MPMKRAVASSSRSTVTTTRIIPTRAATTTVEAEYG
jgi:hypothetical protein